MNFKSLIVISILALAGCGGGGSTNGATNGSSAVFATNAGSAAIGAAMANASISIQPLPSGSNAEVIITADTDGKFTIPSGTKLPAVVKATSANKQWTYYGYIKSVDQVGIPVNPITTTLLTLAAGGHPSTITTPISDAALSTARTQTATLFSALLAATSQSNATDFLSKTFSTDHTGLDLVLDSIGIQLSSTGTISIINKMTGVITQVDPLSILAIPFDSNAIAQMNTLPIAMCSNFLNGLTSQQLTTNSSLYDAQFLESGRNKDLFMNEFLQISVSGFSVSMPIFAGLDSNGNLQFSIQLGNANSNEYITDYALTVKKDNFFDKCVLVGNQHPFEIVIQPAIKTTIRVDSLLQNAVTKFAGLEIYVGAHDDWNFANNDIGQVRIKSARLDVCNLADVCENLATLTNIGGAAKGIFNIDGVSANNYLKMIPNPNVNLFADNSNPIKITFFSSDVAPLSGNVNSIGVIYTRSTAPAYTELEVSQAVLPSVVNYSILSGAISYPSLEWVAGSGVVSELGIHSTSLTTLSDEWKLILKSGTGITNFSVVDPVDPYYKSIHLSGHMPNRPGMLETKYIWAPTCPSCY
ncbi:hypothetical protein [Limnohabitans sp. Jir72]|uniref:hypothetical protein n=1 Tax=Limnohabitans sp. Jir72 TaxID=1977909 RepID=UPI0011B1D319|nr:hypothetical protein [Limnohabitans sp. Jir72]